METMQGKFRSVNDVVGDRNNHAMWIKWQQWDFTHGGADTTRRSMNERSRIVSLNMIGTVGLVLDAGSCDGYFSRILAMKGNDVVSFDLPGVIRQSVSQNPRMCISGDACKMPFKIAVFDAIYASELIEHLFTPDTFIAECHRVLKLDGKLVICTPWSEEASLRHATHWAWFNRDTMTGLLHRYQFGIMQVEMIPESEVMVFLAVKS